MKSCLEALWTLLKEDTSWEGGELNENVANSLADKIEHFFQGETGLGTQEHIKMFCEILRKFSYEYLDECFDDLLQMTKKCNYCVVCKKCAESFYHTIKNKDKLDNVPKLLQDYFSASPQLYYYEKQREKSREKFLLLDKLICLKGFSSSTPAIDSATFNSNCAGGGIYINCKDVGIVIDPGIGFVQNMHKESIYVGDIDYVIVTHNHIDHNADMPILSSLNYDIDRYHRERVKFFNNVMRCKIQSKHEIEWILDNDTRKSLNNSEGQLLSNYLTETDLSDGIKLTAIRTEHMRNNVESYAIKLRVLYDKKEIVIGYTSDTKFFDELTEFFKDANILILNISDIYEKDVRRLGRKYTHLGYNGCASLIERTDAELFLISEFCCTNGDFRKGVIKSLENFSNNSRHILPSDVGLRVSLPKLTVECTRCQKQNEMKNITTIFPKESYGKIEYICHECRV